MSTHPHREPRSFPIVPVIILAVLGWAVAAVSIALSVGPNGFLTGASGGAAVCDLNVPASCIGGTLAGQDLTSRDLTGARLNGADLSGAKLAGVSLFLADLRDADLSGADLSETDLNGAWLDGVDLSGADLSGATVTGVWGSESIVWGDTICPDGSNSDSAPCF